MKESVEADEERGYLERGGIFSQLTLWVFPFVTLVTKNLPSKRLWSMNFTKQERQWQTKNENLLGQNVNIRVYKSLL